MIVHLLQNLSRGLLGLSKLGEEVEEVDRGSLQSRAVDVVGGDPRRPSGTEVVFRQTLEEGVEADLVDQRLGEGAGKHIPPALDIVVQVRVFQLVLQLVEGSGELVRDLGAHLGALVERPVLGNAVVFCCCVLADLLLDVLGVRLVEGGGLAVCEDHVVDVLLVLERQTGKHLERRRGDSTLVGRRVLVEHHALLLEEETGLLGEEEVGTLDNVLEVGLALGIDETRDIRDVDGFGTTTTGDKEVALDAEVEAVTELGAVGDNLARWELLVLSVDEDLVSLRAKLGIVKLDDHLAVASEADELLPVETLGVVDDTRAVNDTNSLVVREQDLVGSEVTVGTTGLELGDLRLLEAVGLVDTEDVLADRERGHAVLVVGDTTELGSRLAGGERLPPRSAARAGVESSPVHHLGGSLIGAEEENLGCVTARDVDNGTLDAWRAAGDQEVDERVNVLLKALLGVGAERGQNSTLGTTFGDVLVLEGLGSSQVVVLVKESTDVGAVVFPSAGADKTNTTTSDVAETDVETAHVGPNDKEHAEGLLGVLDVWEERGVKAERESDLGGLVEVALEDVLVEDEQSLEDLGSVGAACLTTDLGVQVLVRQGLDSLDALERESGSELRCLISGGVVGHGKVDVEETDELGVRLDDLLDALARVGLLTETSLDLGNDIEVIRVVVVEDVDKRSVCGTETVAEVLSKDPSDIGVGGLLYGVGGLVLGNLEERVVGKTVEEGCLTDNLVDRVLYRRSTRVGHRVEVDRDDGDTVRELLDILARRVEAVEVVQVGQGREVLVGAALLVGNDNTLLARVLHLKALDDGAVALLALVHDLLVQLEGVRGGTLKERGVGNRADVGDTVGIDLGSACRELAWRDKVATELLRCGGRDGASRAVRLEAERLFRSRLVKVSVDALLDSGTRSVLGRDTCSGRVDKHSTLRSTLLGIFLGVDLLEVNNKLVWVVLCGCEELGRVERKHVVGNHLRGLGDKVGIVDTERVVEPVDLAVYELLGHKTSLVENLLDLSLLGSLCWEGRLHITTYDVSGGLGGGGENLVLREAVCCFERVLRNDQVAS